MQESARMLKMGSRDNGHLFGEVDSIRVSGKGLGETSSRGGGTVSQDKGGRFNLRDREKDRGLSI